MPFDPGSEIEVQSTEDGFRGAWFEAKVLKHHPEIRKYTVQYASILSDEAPNKLLEDDVYTRHIRPKQPKSSRRGGFKIHELVEAMHNDVWWKGVITEVVSNSSYRVCLPMSREEYVFMEEDVREQMKWVKGIWILSQDIKVDKIKYNVGARVKVSMDKERFGEIWYAGTVLKMIGKNFVLVKYDDIKVSEYNFVKSSEEIVDLEYVTQDRISGRKRKSLDAKTSNAHIFAPTSGDSKNVIFASKDKNTPDVSVLENNKISNGCKPTKCSTHDVEKPSNENETCMNTVMKNQFLERVPKMLAVATPNQTTNNSDSNQTERPQEDVAMVERIAIDLNGTPSIEDWPPINPSLSASSLLGEVNVNHESFGRNLSRSLKEREFLAMEIKQKDSENGLESN